MEYRTINLTSHKAWLFFEKSKCSLMTTSKKERDMMVEIDQNGECFDEEN